tara:strand:- start:49 stop:339 length:291 start_codon:yes stop_codon:yes gene_type:complete
MPEFGASLNGGGARISGTKNEPLKKQRHHLLALLRIGETLTVEDRHQHRSPLVIDTIRIGTMLQQALKKEKMRKHQWPPPPQQQQQPILALTTQKR